jgi:hypothetical protein
MDEHEVCEDLPRQLEQAFFHLGKYFSNRFLIHRFRYRNHPGAWIGEGILGSAYANFPKHQLQSI